MVLPEPHPLAIFSLVPLNDRAKSVLDHPDNIHLVSLIPQAVKNPLKEKEEEDGKPTRGEPTRGLNIGTHIGSKSRYTLATLGRLGDITVEGSSISKIHCSFDVHCHTNEIILWDQSSNGSTQTFGQNAMKIPSRLERPDRWVVVAKKVNNIFGFGGSHCDLFEFMIHWHEPVNDLKERISYREDHPKYTRTLDDETATVITSKPATRIHTPIKYTPGTFTPGVQGQAKKIRYYTKKRIGKGSFGEVWKAVDVDTGEVFALKLIPWPKLGPQSQQYTLLKREVEISASLSHPNIVEFISAQGWGGTHLEVFTGLKDGNLEDLISADLFRNDEATSLLREMLEALDHLAYKGIVHRDVKPENILYTRLPAGSYTFQLTDFGLSNVITDARSYAGSPIYMAPELLSNPTNPQTSKVDVWSLFVTLAYALNVDGFREKPFDTNEFKVRAVQEAARDPILNPLRDMAIIDPSRRASAGEMLDKLFGGKGRSSPRSKAQNDAGHTDAAASKPQPERHPRAKQSRQPDRQRTKCPRCHFEGDKEEVRRHIMFYLHTVQA